MRHEQFVQIDTLSKALLAKNTNAMTEFEELHRAAEQGQELASLVREMIEHDDIMDPATLGARAQATFGALTGGSRNKS